MSQKTGKVFCSYASANLAEVVQFDLALRRCGVPLWRDRRSLAKGALSVEEIEQAAREAVGFTFYLTREAAQSEWVRERERAFALQNAVLDTSFGVVPIFRHNRKEVSDLMIKLGTDPSPTGTRSVYDFSPFNGYLMNERAFSDGTEHVEYCAAADTVLRSLLRTKMKQAGVGAALKVGAMTRSGPLVQTTPCDLLIDWTAEFPPDALRYPNGHTAERNLLRALNTLAKAVAEEWTPYRGARFQLVPQCHLSLALALGYQFRRNTGAELEVIEPQSGELWKGPRIPAQPDHSLWKVSQENTSGEGIALIIGISRSALKDAQLSIRSQSLNIGDLIVLEPPNGPSLTAIPQEQPVLAHQMAATAVALVSELQGRIGCRAVHLFMAVPAAFAVLLGQQLSNLGPVQSYEWSVVDRQYIPTMTLH